MIIKLAKILKYKKVSKTLKACLALISISPINTFINNVALADKSSMQKDSAAADILGLDFINRDWVNVKRPYYPCPGYYNQPTLPNVTLPEIAADSSELTKNGVSVLNGNVIYLDKEQQISAQKAKIARDAKIKKFTKLEVEGDIEYLTPEMRVVSNKLEADLLNNKAYLNTPSYFRYYPRNARGEASKVIITKDKNYKLINSMFTTCPPNNADWKITADEINIDPINQIGTAKNTILYFYNLPIFYTPYLRFPTASQRESGFLMPIYSHSDRYGHAIATPYYFNLAPNYDLTVAPRYMSKRDAQFLIEARHLNNNGANTTNIEYLPNDKEFEHFRKQNITTPPAGVAPNSPRLTNLRHANSQRYALKVNDNRRWNDYLTSDINYSYLSDNQYYLDLPRSEVMRQQSQDHILQQGKVNFNYNNWRTEFLTKGYQTLHTLEGPDLTEPYRILPSVSINNAHINLANYTSSNHTNISAIASIESQASRFASPSNPVANKLAEGQRYYLKPAIAVKFKQPYGYITPKIALNTRHYDLNRLSPTAQMLGYDKQQTYAMPIYSIDSGLYFDKQFTTSKAILNHTIEPRLFYLNIPYKNQNEAPDFDNKDNTITYEQLFRDNIFSGYDRQSNANQITVGLVSRLQNYSNGQEYLKLMLGQTFHFTDRKTTICDQTYDPTCINTEIQDYQSKYSPFITQLNFNFDPKLYGQAEWQWDYHLNTTRKINFGLHYNEQLILAKTPQTIFNLEYNFLKEGNIQRNISGTRLYQVNNKKNDLSSIETSAKIPLSSSLVALGFYSYDLRNKANLDRYLGLELQKCCWALRAGYRSQLRLRTNSLAAKKYDNIFTVQFSLKGLGELNQSFESILRSNIPGYNNQLDQIY